MATRNREALLTMQEVYVDSLKEELDNVETPVLEALGLVERLGPRRAQALDMMSIRNYGMMREWIGQRDESFDREVFKSRVFSTRYEDSVRIPIEDIEDLNLANYDPQDVAAMLREAFITRVQHEQHQMLIHAMDDAFHGGETVGPRGEIIYVGSLDGKALLSDSHPYYAQIDFDSNAGPGQKIRLTQGGEYSNLVNTELTADNLWAARQQFRTLKDHRGRPANFGRPDTLVVGPALERQARDLLENSLQVVDTGNGVTATDNTTATLNLNVVVNDWLDGNEVINSLTFGGTTYTEQDLDTGKFWYLVNSSSQRKPFVTWMRKEPEIQQPIGNPDLSSPNPAAGSVSYSAYNDDSAKLGIRARWGHSFGVPQVILGSLGGQTLSNA